MNDEYARDISNKVKSVYRTKALNGEFVGGTTPYGYKKNPENKYQLIIDEDEANNVKLIFKKYLEGDGQIKICKYSNDNKILCRKEIQRRKKQDISLEPNTDRIRYNWSKSTIGKILTNETYIGNVVQNRTTSVSYKNCKVVYKPKDEWIVVKNTHEPIIDRKDFDKVQNILEERNSEKKKPSNLSIYYGKIKCADCGCNLSMVKPKGKVYYYCTSYMRHKECTSHSITKEKIEKAVLEIINKQIELMVDVEEKINEIAKKENINYDLEILKGRLEDVEESLSKYNLFKRSVLADYESNFISREDYEEYNLEYSKKMKQLLKNKEKIENEIKKMENVPQKENNILDKYNKKIENLDKTIIDELIEYIYISEDKTIRIVFKYEDEYNSAIDFIKKHNCDIIDENYSENIYKEVI